MKSYQKALDDLYALNRHGIKLGLDPTREVLRRLGNPHHRFVSFHIGGTNGKGSSAVQVATVLQAAGYRVGLYTSPHLSEFGERIRVQGVNIPAARVVELTHQIQVLAGATLSLTFFEFTTAMAFQYFSKEHIDVGVIEVGLGGRFDATNVLDPLGVLITNIASDHEQYLGNTLASIAYEKAGIVKKGGTVVLGPMPDSPRQVIESFTQEQRAHPYRWDKEFFITKEIEQKFGYQGSHWSFPGLSCSLNGDHQILNAACAVALLEVGALKGLKVSESAIRRGLATVHWEGRLETVSHAPPIVLDGAHNAASAQVLFSYLAKKLQTLSHARLILVVGMMKDKDHRAFLEVLSPLADYLIFTSASLPRAASPRALRQALPRNACPVLAEVSPPEAIKMALKHATPDGSHLYHRAP